MSVLSNRYAGVVDAYEIWKAPNILKYWTAPVYDQAPQTLPDGDFALPDRIDIGAVHYLKLLRLAYEAIKSADSAALVITAGLAPVGFTDHYNSIETGTFLQNCCGQGPLNTATASARYLGHRPYRPSTFVVNNRPASIHIMNRIFSISARFSISTIIS